MINMNDMAELEGTLHRMAIFLLGMEQSLSKT